MPKKGEGYAFETVKPRAHRMDAFYRFVWESNGGYTTPHSLDGDPIALGWYRQFREIILMFAIINIESLCEPL